VIARRSARIRWLLLLSGLGALAGCVTTYTYDAVPIGPQTYRVKAVAAPADGGIAGAQHLATEAAYKTCWFLGKTTTVTNVETVHEFPPAARAVVTFTCE